MNIGKWRHKISLKKINLKDRLNLVIGLLFVFPILGFLYFSIKYDILADKDLPLFFLGVLFFLFIGVKILSSLLNEITHFSRNISSKASREFAAGALDMGENELTNLVESFAAIESQFSRTMGQLERKKSEISTLKELSELCYVTFDSDEILYVTLERALDLTRSDVGSILILEEPGRGSFTVKASIGHGGMVKVGDRINFESSIAKYAVINKSPLLVRDIETENRFGRTNRLHYGTKSFICMPIKTSKDVVGVLTISRKDMDDPYSQEDVDAITSLLSNAAFTYENLRLLKKNEKAALQLRVIDKIFKIVNSSVRGAELIHSILGEIRGGVPADLIVLMTMDEHRPGFMKVVDLLAHTPTRITNEALIDCRRSVVEKTIEHENLLFINEVNSLSAKADKALFIDNGAVSGVIAPLKTGGVVTGVLCLASRERAVFDGFRNLITWMAYGLSLAMERNGLYKAVVKRNLELEAIKHIGSALASSTFDLNKVFNYTMEMIKRIMKVEAGSLFLLENNHLHFAVDFNVQKKSLKKFRLKLGQGIAGHVATRGEAIIVNETRESLHFFPDIDKETGFKTRSVLCVPMISQGRVIGVLEVLNKINGDFDAKDQNLLQSIASSVSIGIENARLYEETVSMTEHERGIRRVFQKFVPKEIIDKIIHGDESGKTVLEELKTLTLLNIDIRNFSGLSRRMGPRKTVALLNHFFSVMGGVIFKNNGIVDKYLGDGFLAIFGAPASSAADADNALLAALEMQKSLGAVNDYLFENLGARVNIGISVHTGEVVAGNIGFDRKMDYTVIGDSVNEVFKLQKYTKAHLDGIIISESVRRATRLRLKVREDAVGPDGEPLSEDMKIYELLGLNSQNGGNGLGERPFMVFVGAHADLARCRRIAERLRGAGRPACISPIHLPGKGERHRIFIGGYESERAARKAAEALNRGQFPHANVVRYPYIILVGLYTPGPSLAEAEAVLASMGLAPHRDGPPGPDGRTPLFLGAFKDREEAAGLTRLLEEAGFSPEVTLR